MKLELVSLGVVSLLATINASSDHEFSVATSLDNDIESDANREHSNTAQKNSKLYLPWTHKPVCTDYLNDIGAKLCVYTNASFSNGRGISIFTTPEIAQKFASLPPFQDATVLSSSGINPVANSKKQAWYTSLIPSKGIGMFASRPLERGDQITAYTPYLLAHMENILSTEDREYHLRLAVEQLPKASRDTYLSLAKIYHQQSVVGQDVVKANAFEIQVGGVMHLAVFPESSRFNHACAPKYAFPSPIFLAYVS